jgi:hypothetical protein
VLEINRAGDLVKLPRAYTRRAAVVRLSDAAFRLHLSALDWCSEQRTEGTLWLSDLSALPHAPTGRRLGAAVSELEQAGLWSQLGDAWRILDAERVDPDLSSKRAEAGRAGGVAKALALAKQKPGKLPSTLPDGEVASCQPVASLPGPDPSSPLELSSPDSSGFPSDSALLAASSLRSDPEPADSFSHVGATKPKRRWRRVPTDWEPTDEHRAIARERGVDFELELSKFRDHEFATAKSDANGTFRNWLRNARSTVTTLALPNRQAPGSNFERLRARADRMERERKEQEARNAAG